MACATLAFSQSSQPMQGDPIRKFKPGKHGSLSINNPLNKEKLDVPFNTRTPLWKDKEVKKGAAAGKNLMAQKGMPIIKPQGSFPMPVYKPDSTIRFTMQIKEYKRISPNDNR